MGEWAKYDPDRFVKRETFRNGQVAVRCMLEGGHGPWAVMPEWTVDAGVKVCARCGHEEGRKRNES